MITARASESGLPIDPSKSFKLSWRVEEKKKGKWIYKKDEQ
jgi:hypothetical protein